MNFFWEALTNNLQYKKSYLPTSKSVLQHFQVLLFEVLSTSCPWRQVFCYKRENINSCLKNLAAILTFCLVVPASSDNWLHIVTWAHIISPWWTECDCGSLALMLDLSIDPTSSLLYWPLYYSISEVFIIFYKRFWAWYINKESKTLQNCI